jgi:hypothetical protein
MLVRIPLDGFRREFFACETARHVSDRDLIGVQVKLGGRRSI